MSDCLFKCWYFFCVLLLFYSCVFIYYWLDAPDSQATKGLVEKQVKLAASVLTTCETRKRRHEKITAIFNCHRYDTPFRSANKYFYFHNTGLQPQSVLYVQVSHPCRVCFFLLRFLPLPNSPKFLSFIIFPLFPLLQHQFLEYCYRQLLSPDKTSLTTINEGQGLSQTWFSLDV